MPNKPKGNQYQSFAALKGFGKKIKEMEVETCDKKILSEESLEELNEKVMNLKKGDYIKVVYYKKNKYEEISDYFVSVDNINKILILSHFKISFLDLYNLERDYI